MNDRGRDRVPHDHEHARGRVNDRAALHAFRHRDENRARDRAHENDRGHDRVRVDEDVRDRVCVLPPFPYPFLVLP